MTSSVYVTFGADTGALTAAFALAKAETAALGRDMRTLATEMQATGAAADSELGQRLSGVASQFAVAKEHVKEFQTELREAGRAPELEVAGGHLTQIREVLQGLTSPLRAVRENLGEIAEGFVAAFAVEKVAEFVKSMGELGEKTERTSKILGISVEEVGRLNYIFGITGTQIENVDRVFGRFEEGLAKAASTGTGQLAAGLQALGLSAQELIGLSIPEQLERIADQVSKFADSSTKTAALQSLGRQWVELIPLLDQGGAKLRELAAAADATNTTLSASEAEGLERLKQGMYDLGAAVEGNAILAFQPFVDVLGAAVAIMRDMATAVGASIKQGGDWADILHEVAQALKVVLSGIVLIIEALKTLGSAAGGALNAVNDYFTGLGKTLHDAITGNFAEIEKDSKEANARVAADVAQATVDIVAAEKTAADEINRIWAGVEGPKFEGAGAGTGGRSGTVAGGLPNAPALDDSKLGNLNREIDAAAARLRALGVTTGDATALIKGFEGFKSSAYYDVNHYRVGYGSDTTTSAIGQVSSVTAGTVATREDAERDLARRIVEFQTAAASAIGSAWAGLSDKAKASITSVTYNYGRTPDSVVAAAQTGNESNIAGAISGLSGANGGVNAARRQAEAANITAPAAGDTDAIRAQEAEYAKLLEQRQKLNEAAQGGSAIEKANLEIARQEASGAQNQVTIAKEKLAAAQQEAATNKAAIAPAGIDTAKQLDLEQKVAEAQKAVNTAVNAQAEAEAKVNVAKAKQVGDIKQIYDAEVAAATVRLHAAGADPTKQAAATQELIQAQTSYTNAVREQASTRGRLEIEAATAAANKEIELLNARLKMHQISDGQALSGKIAALNQEAAVVQEVYAKELASAQEGSNKKIEIALQEQKKLAEIAKQETDAQIKAAEDAQRAWQTVSNDIVGVFTTGLKGMLTGHETFRQAATKALEGLVNKSIDLIGQMVSKWLAGQLAQTAATVTGVAARTAATTAGSAAALGPLVAQATRAITVDAGEAGAGVTAFLAPFIGPAAPAAGAAAQASTLAFAAFDIGAYDVPRTQMALVHQNELVMPAPQASAFRSMLEGGSGGGKSVNINPSANFHVSALDGASVASFFKSNQRELMKAINSSVRSGAHLGLSALR